MTEPLRLDPKRCAVILIDMINASVKGKGPPYNPVTPERQLVVSNFDRLLSHCRSVRTPLVYITTHRRPDDADAPKTIADIGGGVGVPMTPASSAAKVIDELLPQPEDHIIVKPRFSAFYGTNLDGTLRAFGTETILVGGISTPRSVEGTARDAKNRDLQCIVVSDCCTGPELDVHEFTIKRVLPLLVRVRTTDQVIAALRP